MHSTNFHVLGCSHCLANALPTVIYNFTAELDKKIDPTEIHSKDPRLAILEKIYPGDSVQLPTTVIDSLAPIKQFGLTMVKPVARFVIKSNSTTDYTLNFLRMLNNNTLNLY
jgi:hypothetical protein